MWDFRLFSYGYRQRGVGTFAAGMARAIAGAVDPGDIEIYIWGNKSHVPADLARHAAKWVGYTKGSWVTDLLVVPFLILRHRIDLFHYWIALGPVFRIGIGLFHPGRTSMTIHDCAVQFLQGNGHLDHVRGTTYWRVQKKLLERAGAIVCNSRKTEEEVRTILKDKPVRTSVIYLPVAKAGPHNLARTKTFVTLAGAPHKNVRGVVQGFMEFAKSHPGFCCAVLGVIDTSEQPLPESECIRREGMDRYEYYLDNAAGIAVCSTYEGLGIPVLDALSRGCPVIASDMPVFHETCGDGFARFVDPRNPAAIAEGLSDVADHQEEWMKKSEQGYERYRKMSEPAGRDWVALYDSLCVKK